MLEFAGMNKNLWREQELPTASLEVRWAKQTKTFSVNNPATPSLEQVQAYIDQVWAVKIFRFFGKRQRLALTPDIEGEEAGFTSASIEVYKSSIAIVREVIGEDDAHTRIERATSYPLVTSLERISETTASMFPEFAPNHRRVNAGADILNEFYGYISHPEQEVYHCFLDYARKVFKAQERYYANRQIQVGTLPPSSGSRIGPRSIPEFREG